MTERAELERLAAAAADRRDLSLRWRPAGGRRWASLELRNVPAAVAGDCLLRVAEELDPTPAQLEDDDELEGDP